MIGRTSLPPENGGSTMKKHLLATLLALALVWALSIPAAASEPPFITQQPQNPTFNEYAVATYSVTVYGENLHCTWYLNFEGQRYNISDTSSGVQPWEAYAGETYGPTQTDNGTSTTFSYFFGGIGPELNGSYLYAVIEDGHFDVTSDKAYISLVADIPSPPVTFVPAFIEIYQGEPLDLYCSATAPNGEALSYLWYSCSSGQLQDIVAINDGMETSDTLRCPTDLPGTRYYVCGVATAAGGSAYTSVIPVTVLPAPEAAAEETPPADTPPPAASGEEHTAGASETNTDIAEAPAGDAAAEGPAVTADADTAPALSEGPAAEAEDGFPVWAIILIAAAAAVIGALAAVFVIKHKR